MSAERIMQLWQEGRVEEAVYLNEQCRRNDMLSDDDKAWLQGIPGNSSILFAQNVTNSSDKGGTAYQAALMLHFLGEEGFDDAQIIKATRLKVEELATIRKGRLRKKTLLARLALGFTTLISGVDFGTFMSGKEKET